MNLKQLKSIYFVGIKGVAMTALAILAKEKGIQVSGSDVEEEFPTDNTLHRFKIPHVGGFDPKHLPDQADLVIYTGAHQGIHNPEVQAALKLKIPVLPHGKALGLFMKGYRGITVAGSHGKTTTSALLAHLLTKLNTDPSFAIGCGEILSLQTSGYAGKGKFFVAEGDEYVTDPTTDLTPRFMWQNPEILVVTNIDFDHPDVYKDLESIKQEFIKFANSLNSNAKVILNIDDTATNSIINKLKPQVITYGQSQLADYQLSNLILEAGVTRFKVIHNNQELGSFSLKIPGVHNCLNATATIASLVTIGFNPQTLVQPLESFSGTKRRFEKIGEKQGKLLYDDYAHHPVEISATLKAAKEWFPGRRLIAIFQPHTFSRTQALLHEFGQCFRYADTVLITEIYASAREKPITGISGQVLCAEVKKHTVNVHFTPQKADVLQYLRLNSRSEDLVLVMGAGDIFTWLEDILGTF